jgi:Protein of unknown function (DUF1194)
LCQSFGMTLFWYRVHLGFAAMMVAVWLASPLHAQVVPPGDRTRVDLELILAVDISLSMDYEELRVQRSGYVAAFRDPVVQGAIFSGPVKRIAVTYFEWAGRSVQKIIADWTIIDSPAAAHAFADTLERAPISRERMTSISAAMEFAGQMFDRSPVSSPRRVLDISGDGPNNAGTLVTTARDRLVAKGIAINGLPLVLKSSGTVFDIADLDIYYADCVIGGPAAFSLPVRAEAEFAPSIRRKLLLEIAHAPPPLLLQAQMMAAPEPRISCTIGEHLWRLYMDGRYPN